MNPPAVTLPALLRQAAARFPERTAVRIIGEEPVSYRRLAERVESLACWMAGRGAGRGDRIMVRADNGLLHFYAYLAASRLGAAAVPVGSGLSASAVKNLVGDCRPALGFADEPGAEALAAAGVETAAEGDSEYRRALAAPTAPLPEPDPSDTALIIYTSGTTGHPKGVCLSQDAIARNAALAALSQEFGEHEVYLTSTPLYHASAGLRVFTMARGGHTHLVLPRFTVPDWLEAVEGGRVASTIAVPTQISRILDHPSYAPERLVSLRLLVYGAAPSARSLLRRMREEASCGLYHGYGLTEACTVVTALTAADHRNLTGPDDPRLGSVGRPIPGVEAVVRRPDGTAAEPGEVGEITVRSRKVMSGYWGNPQETAAAFRDGWLLTGDLATEDEEGYLTIVGRSREVIISGGANVYPAQVERAIAAHPGVEEAAVFGVEDEEWGETPAAAVKLRPGAQVGEQEVKDLVAGSLERRARPRYVVFVDEFPRTPAGKIRKPGLPALLKNPRPGEKGESGGEGETG